MGFGGPAAVMVQSIRNNAQLLATRNNYFENGVAKKYGTSTNIIDHKKLSPAQFEAFKHKLKESELRSQKTLAMIFGSVILVTISGLAYLLFFYSPSRLCIFIN